MPAWSYLVFAAAVLSVFFYLDFATICTETKDLKLAWLRSLILYNCIGFTAIIVLINVWSIAQIHEYLRKNSKKIESEKDLPCDYCSKSPAGPLICSNCNSILWVELIAP